jgi:hypothetical protein
MNWTLRTTGFSCFLASLLLLGACAKDDDDADGGTDSADGQSDDGGTTGDQGTADDGGTDDGGTGDGTGGTQDDGSTGTETGTGGTGSSGGTGTGGGDVQCIGDPPVFPEFDKSCGGDQDCALVFHTIDCCGTDVAWGINVDDVAAFDAAEAICDSQYPPCGCAPSETEAEDGNASFNPDDFAVTCRDGTCMSYIP